MTSENLKLYEFLKSSFTSRQWERVGVVRRAGVAAPLFSLYSKRSVGIGEIPDLKLLIDWCLKTGLSIIQLLPMNDVGFDFAPYDAKSTFALDPMYLSLEALKDAEIGSFRDEIAELRKKFPAGGQKVNYEIKKAKLEILWRIFKTVLAKPAEAFLKFIETNQFWIQDYALFKTLKEINSETSWQSWPAPARSRELIFMGQIQKTYPERILFHQWMQWQLFEEFREVKKYAESKKVLLMGDLPFLVSRDSADVWAHQSYFKMHLSSGAPPDMYFAGGQRWGMPPYDWPKIAGKNYDYVIEKLRYAENFYDMFRIDHVVGMFRVWTIRLEEPAESAGLKGVFDPQPEDQWEEHGRNLLSIMIRNTEMLPCAEDLGVVPECSDRVLNELGIPGTDVQRWIKNWKTDYAFKASSLYRASSMAVISTHDSSSLAGWWEFEAGTVDEALFKRKCAEKGISFDGVCPRLFDLERSRFGRLRWKDEVRDIHHLFWVLERPHHEVSDFASLYLGSFDEKRKYWEYIGSEAGAYQEKPSTGLVRAAIAKCHESSAIFSIQLLQDWLSLAEIPQDTWHYRINFPGTSGPENWSLVAACSLEELNQLSVNHDILNLSLSAGRAGF